MDDGPFLAFFEATDMPFEFKPQRDFDLHIALEVDESSGHSALHKWCSLGKSGVVDHGMVHSIYLRDPNGYVIELTAKMAGHDEAMNPQTNGARAILDKWQATKSGSVTSQS